MLINSRRAPLLWAGLLFAGAADAYEPRQFRFDGAYPGFLSAFVSDIRQHGAHPVLVTPAARRTFNAAGKIENSHAGYDDAVRALAAKLAVPLIDLTAITTRMYETLGPELAPSAFAKGGQDTTHHNAYGAYVIACFVARGLTAVPGLGIRPAFDNPVCEPERFGGPRDYGLVKADWPGLRAIKRDAIEATNLTNPSN